MDRLKAAFQYALGRFKEASTWRGLIGIAAAFPVVSGYVDSTEEQAAVIAVGLLLAGIVGAAFPDKKG